MDPWIVVGLIAVVLPVAVIWALAKSASLRGPEPRPRGGRPVGSLVTEVIADDRPEEEREYPDDAVAARESGERERSEPPPPDTWR